MTTDSLKNAILQQLKSLEHNYRMLTQDFIEYNYRNREFLTDTKTFNVLIGNMLITLHDLQTYVLTQVFPGDKNP